MQKQPNLERGLAESHPNSFFPGFGQRLGKTGEVRALNAMISVKNEPAFVVFFMFDFD
jgi:hypothetical protein